MGKYAFKSLVLSAFKIIIFLCLAVALLELAFMLISEMRIRSQQQVLTGKTSELAGEINQKFFFDTQRAIAAMAESGNIQTALSNGAKDWRDVTLQLNTIRETISASIVYIMDKDGTVKASSDYTVDGKPGESLVGNNYSFRPYFTRSIAGQKYSYHGVGVTSKARGVYFSAPIYLPNNPTPQGVAVIKTDVSRADEILSTVTTGKALLLTEESIVFASSDPKLLYQVTAKVSDEFISKIYQSKQFPVGTLIKSKFILDPIHETISDNNYLMGVKGVKLPGWWVAIVMKKNYDFPLAQTSMQALVTSALWTIPLVIVVIALIFAMSRVHRLQLMYLGVFNGTYQYMEILDVSGRLLEINKPAYSLYPGDVEKYKGEFFWDTQLWNHNSNLMQRLRNAVEKAGRGETDRFEAYHFSEDGEKVFVDCSISPIIEPNGKIMRLVAERRDITIRRKLEERLRHSHKIEAIGQLAGGIAHDFNNMIGGIIGYSEIIKSEYSNDPRLDKWADGIYKTARRAADLTEQLLLFSRKGRIEKRSFNMHEIIESAIEIIKRTVDKRIQIEYSPNAKRDNLYGDPAQLENIVINFGINSRDAMPNGGVFSIKTENLVLTDEQAKIISSDMNEGDYFLLHVQDTGCGIKEEIFDKIFDPFFTTKEVGKGTGLGLSAVYGTIAAHHGGIRARSKVGHGTDFYVYLPILIPEKQEEPKIEPPANYKFINTNARILYIDDEKTILSTTSQLLATLGYEVTQAVSGSEGLEIFSETPERFDVILLDLAMPDLSGTECFLAMKKIRPDIKIILTSGFPESDEIKNLNDKWPLQFIQKPFTRERLSSVIIKTLHT